MDVLRSVSLAKSIRPHFAKLDELKAAFDNESGPKYAQLSEIVNNLSLIDLNRAIFRCDHEERDMGNDTGVYDIPGYGPLVYCGTQGFISVLSEIAPNNDLGHPFCNNLREGNWMIGELWTFGYNAWLVLKVIRCTVRRLCPQSAGKEHRHRTVGRLDQRERTSAVRDSALSDSQLL